MEEAAAVVTLPADAENVRIIPDGYSFVYCEICRGHIGIGRLPYGYRSVDDAKGGTNSEGPWLCERDYERYVTKRDISFIYEVPD